jgi:hypothetical protein
MWRWVPHSALRHVAIVPHAPNLVPPRSAVSDARSDLQSKAKVTQNYLLLIYTLLRLLRQELPSSYTQWRSQLSAHAHCELAYEQRLWCV